MSEPALTDQIVGNFGGTGTRATLRYDHARQLLISDKSGLAYPIRDGIPIMLRDEAIPVEKLDDPA